MLNYIVLVNKEKRILIVDFKTNVENCNPDVGYETDCEWSTENPEYMQDNDIFFDVNKAFKECGIYEVIGYDNSCDTPDGYIEDYMVENIVKLADLPY